MYSAPDPLPVHHSCNAWAMNSGPLSIRKWVGAGYCLRSSSIESITSIALHRLPTRIAKHMRLYSSTIFRNFNLLPSIVWSNWKSIAHAWCGYSALSSPQEPHLAPDPLHPLVIDAPALDSQAPANQSPTPADVAPGQLPNPLPELVFLNVCHRHWPSLGGAVLADQTAGTALGNPKSILQKHDSSVAPPGALCSAPTFRAQKFLVAPQGAPHGARSSLRMALSSSTSANKRYSFGEAFG